MSVTQFPFRFSFEQARKQAKDLQRELRRDASRAIDRLVAHHPEGLGATPTKLADAQLVVAREHGFESWARLRAYAEPDVLYQNEMIVEGVNEVIHGPWERQERMLRDLAAEALAHCGLTCQKMTRAGHMGNFGFSDYALSVVTEGTAPSHLVTVHYTYDDVFSFDEMHRQVASLCAWLLALDRDTDLEIQAPVPDATGNLCQRIDHRPDGPAAVCTVQRWVPGEDLVDQDWDGWDLADPDGIGLPQEAFRDLGSVLARIHEHGRDWTRPDGFNRMRVDREENLSELRVRFWQTGERDPSEEDLVARAMEEIGRQRQEQGEPWGLTHGDYRAANVVVEQGRYKAIDFDLCSLSHQYDDIGWCLVDVPDPSARRAFLDGYRGVSSPGSAPDPLIEGALVAARVRRCAWGGDFPASLLWECRSYLRGEAFLLEPPADA